MCIYIYIYIILYIEETNSKTRSPEEINTSKRGELFFWTHKPPIHSFELSRKLEANLCRNPYHEGLCIDFCSTNIMHYVFEPFFASKSCSIYFLRKDFKIVFRNCGFAILVRQLSKKKSPPILSTLEKNREVLECLGAVEAAMQKQWQFLVSVSVSQNYTTPKKPIEFSTRLSEIDNFGAFLKMFWEVDTNIYRKYSSSNEAPAKEGLFLIKIGSFGF